MDDIAGELGISKKTVYKHFSNKAEIVQANTTVHFEEQKQDCDRIHDEAENAVEETILLMAWLGQMMKDISPSMVYDVQKYYPESWKQFQDFKMDYLQGTIRQNIIEGIEQGVYRPELEVEILAKYRVEIIDMVFNPEVFPPDKFDLTQVQLTLMEHFVHGLVTTEGKRRLDEYLAKLTHESAPER